MIPKDMLGAQQHWHTYIEPLEMPHLMGKPVFVGVLHYFRLFLLLMLFSISFFLYNHNVTKTVWLFLFSVGVMSI